MAEFSQEVFDSICERISMERAVASIYGLADSETGEVRYIGKQTTLKPALKAT